MAREDWPPRILFYRCESCGGAGTSPGLIHESNCEALGDWHRWHEQQEREEKGDPTLRELRGECPVEVPIRMLAYVPSDEKEHRG